MACNDMRQLIAECKSFQSRAIWLWKLCNACSHSLNTESMITATPMFQDYMSTLGSKNVVGTVMYMQYTHGGLYENRTSHAEGLVMQVSPTAASTMRRSVSW